jgi:hypothetical protein
MSKDAAVMNDENPAFYRKLAHFRARNRAAAWEFLVGHDQIDRARAVELQCMIDKDPAGFRSAMIGIARDCGVLRALSGYLPFSKGEVELGRTCRHNMVVMIAEVVATREQAKWEPLEKHPRVARKQRSRRRDRDHASASTSGV